MECAVLEGTHQDHGVPARGAAQDTPTIPACAWERCPNTNLNAQTQMWSCSGKPEALPFPQRGQGPSWKIGRGLMVSDRQNCSSCPAQTVKAKVQIEELALVTQHGSPQVTHPAFWYLLDIGAASWGDQPSNIPVWDLWAPSRGVWWRKPFCICSEMTPKPQMGPICSWTWSSCVEQGLLLEKFGEKPRMSCSSTNISFSNSQL